MYRIFCCAIILLFCCSFAYAEQSLFKNFHGKGFIAKLPISPEKMMPPAKITQLQHGNMLDSTVYSGEYKDPGIDLKFEYGCMEWTITNPQTAPTFSLIPPGIAVAILKEAGADPDYIVYEGWSTPQARYGDFVDNLDGTGLVLVFHVKKATYHVKIWQVKNRIFIFKIFDKYSLEESRDLAISCLNNVWILVSENEI